MTLLSRLKHSAKVAVWLPFFAGAFLACSEDVSRPLSPAPGAPTEPTTIVASPRLTSIETDVLDALGRPTRVLCTTCHDVVDVGSPALATTDLTEFHTGLSFQHGQMACNNCHEPGLPLKLRLATGQQIAMEDALDLCSQCHGLQKRSYDHGAHGGMKGYWDLSRGPRLKNHCVDCHDPHTPQISQVIPAKRTIDRSVVQTHKGHL